MNLTNRTFRLFIVSLALGSAVVTARAQADASLTAETTAPAFIAGTRVTAKLTVHMDAGWHISSLSTPDGGPVRTEIALAKGSPFMVVGKIKVPEPMRRHDDAFGVDVETYEGEVQFSIPLEVTKDIPRDTKIALEITYQACSEENCMLPRTDKLTAPVSLSSGGKAGK